jgi:uncharacterized delta-60 repeat protein
MIVRHHKGEKSLIPTYARLGIRSTSDGSLRAIILTRLVPTRVSCRYAPLLQSPTMVTALFANRTARTKTSRRHRSLQIEQLENRSLLAVASLDAQFGDNGVVETSVPTVEGSEDSPFRFLQQVDGKLLAIGRVGVYPAERLAVARLLPDGTRDLAFGTNGVAVLSSEFLANESSIAVQGDGKILIGGHSNGQFSSPRLARLDNAGQFDPTFGDAGYATFVGGPERINQVIVQNDGKVLVGGATGGFSGLAVTRLLADGEIDPSYGDHGTQRFAPTETVMVFDMALQPDGKLVAAALRHVGDEDVVVLTRFAADGQPDVSFGELGVHQSVMGPPVNTGWYTDTYDLAISPDGSIAVVGTILDEVTDQAVTKVIALTKDGLPATTFSGDGIAQISLSEHTISGGVAALADGSIVVAGYYGPDSGASYHYLTKLTNEGSVDPQWGTEGFATADLSLSFDLVKDVLIGADGGVFTIVETWAPDTFNDITITKWLPRGVLDSSFNGSGVSTVDIDQSQSTVRVDQLLSNPGGGLMLLGQVGSHRRNMAAVSYSPEGNLERSFGQGGVQQFSSALQFGRGALQADGKLVVAVTEQSNGYIYGVYPTRYLPDGSIDPTFSVQRTGTERRGNIHAQQVIAQADGNTVVVTVDYNYRGLVNLTRYLPDGRIDQGFGTGGVLELDEAYGQVLGAVEHDGAIYVLTCGLIFDPATGLSSAQRVLRRIDPTGRIDTAFGRPGGIVVDDDMAQTGKLLLDNQQRLVAVTARVAKRYLLDGTPDLSFGEAGVVVLPAGFIAPPVLQAAAVNARGQVFITRRFLYSEESSLELVRLGSDGSVDSDFSTGASEIIQAQDFVDFPGLVVSGNEITIGGTSVDELDVNFQLVRIQSGEHSAWQNPTNRLNVDNDAGNNVVPLDALLIINQLNLFGARELSPDGPASESGHFFDVNGDNYLSAIDALMVINYLNSVPFNASSTTQAAEGESSEAATESESLALSELPLVSAKVTEEVSHDISAESFAYLYWSTENDRDRDRF